MHDDLRKLAVYAGWLSTMLVLLTSTGAEGLQRVEGVLANVTQPAAAFFVTSITAQDIQKNYEAASSTDARQRRRNKARNDKVQVLIVPGHQPKAGGTEFGPLTERDLVVDIAQALSDLLAQNPHYAVTVSRGKEAWNPLLQSYFDMNTAEISAFKDSQIAQMAEHMARGTILPTVDQVHHNKASTSTALQLYGLNKWASDYKIDITLHLHLNDYAGRRAGQIGRYDGFAVYVPDRQYSNAAASREIGWSIARRLNAFHATSTLPREDVGVVEDQELIAIGVNNSTDAAALLIEYGYIYEPQFRDASTRSIAVEDYAYATYLGLQDFFDDAPATSGSAALPYAWSSVSLEGGARGADVYAVQSALRELGFYPPVGKSFSECPVSGTAGSCTFDALRAYQRARGLDGTGILGTLTRIALEQDLGTP